MISALEGIPTALNTALGPIAICSLPLAHNAIALLMFPIFGFSYLGSPAANLRRSRGA